VGTSEIERTAAGYLALCAGDCAAALRAAVADLLDVHVEAEFRKLALDQWVSHGYVQGRASERLAAARQRGGGPGGESASADPPRDGESSGG
jgi:hypothetical protein